MLISKMSDSTDDTTYMYKYTFCLLNISSDPYKSSKLNTKMAYYNSE